jgi:hypothetical protein
MGDEGGLRARSALRDGAVRAKLAVGVALYMAAGVTARADALASIPSKRAVATNVAPRAVGSTAIAAAMSNDLTVNVSGEGIVTYSDGSAPCSASGCSTHESPHSLVFLTATPAQGYTFKRWTAGCVGPGAICGITPAQAPVVSALFVHTGAVQLTVSGPGRIEGDGGAIACGMDQSSCSDDLSGTGTTHFTVRPAAGAVFLGWGGACAQFATHSCTVDDSAFSGATAAFAPTSPSVGPQPLTVGHDGPTASAPDGLDSCLTAVECKTSVPSGSYYTLTAGGSFVSTLFGQPSAVSWSGGCVGTWPICSLIVDGPTAIQVSTLGSAGNAGNGPAAVTLPVTVTGKGRLRAVRGTLTPRGCGSVARGGGYSCMLEEAGGAFVLRAIPVGRNKFRGWGSSMYRVCKPAKRPQCSASVVYEGPALAVNFTGR